MAIPSPRVYRFGAFHLDAAGELRRGNELLTLSPRVLNCLLYLVEHRERPVGRDELAEAIWGHTHLSESALGQVVRQLRQVLGDSGDDQRMVKTIRGHGYRWAVPVENLSRRLHVEPVSPALKSRMRRGSQKMVVAVMLLIVLAACAFYYWLRTGTDTAVVDIPAIPRSEHGIALLLPVDVEAENDYHWIRFGAMELIANRLREAGLAVVPGDTVIALMRGLSDTPDLAGIKGLSSATGASLVFGVRAEKTGVGWRVSIRSLSGESPALSALAEAEDVLDAAHVAADRMALSLGLRPAADPGGEPGLTSLLQQAEAAMMAQQMDIARELIESAEIEFQEQSEVRLQLAFIEFHSHNIAAAEAIFMSLLSDPSVKQSPALLARVMNGIGVVRSRQGDQDAALSMMNSALGLLEDENVPALSGTIRRSLGAVALRRGEFDEARVHMARARQDSESVGDARNLAILDNNMGVLESLRGRYAEALPYFESSANYRAALHDLGEELRDYANMVEVYLGLLNPGSALAALGVRLDELIAQTSNPEIAVLGNMAKAMLFADNGQLQEAENVLSEVLRAVETQDDLSGVRPRALVLYAEQLVRRGDFTQAARVASEMVEQSRYGNDILLDDYLGRAWLILLQARISEGDIEAAADISAAIGHWAERSPVWSPKIYAALAQAQVAVAEGRNAVAESAFEYALSLADSTQVPLRLLQVAEHYVQWLISQSAGENVVSERMLVLGDRFTRYTDRHYGAALLQLRIYHALGFLSNWDMALDRVRVLAGEREIPPELLTISE